MTTNLISPTTNLPDVLINAFELPRLAALATSARVSLPDVAATLRIKLDSARISQSDEILQGVVQIGSTIRVRDLNTGREETFRLVYPESADVATSQYSVLSPFGIALLGVPVKTTVEFRTRLGQQQRALVLSVDDHAVNV
jgi:regulator of nucleoside diphosphate kinase